MHESIGPPGQKGAAMVTMLWTIAVVLMVAGVLALVAGQWRYGAGLIIAAFVLTPGLLRFVG